MIQKQEQELQHEARKQEQELRFREQEFQSEAKKQEQEFRVREQEFHVKEQEFQFEVKKQIFLHERRDKQLAFMQDGHELYMMQQRDLASKLREQHQDLASRQREIDKYMCAEQE